MAITGSHRRRAIPSRHDAWLPISLSKTGAELGRFSPTALTPHSALSRYLATHTRDRGQIVPNVARPRSYRLIWAIPVLYSISSSDPSGVGRLRWITALTDPASGYLPNRSRIPHLIPYTSPSATSRPNLTLDMLFLEYLLCRTCSTSKSIYSRLFRNKNTLFRPSDRLS